MLELILELIVISIIPVLFVVWFIYEILVNKKDSIIFNTHTGGAPPMPTKPKKGKK